MTTMTVRAEVTADRVLKLEIPCNEPPGLVDVLLTIQPHRPIPESIEIDWGQLTGLGREVWHGVDAARHLADLRADREPPQSMQGHAICVTGISTLAD